MLDRPKSGCTTVRELTLETSGRLVVYRNDADTARSRGEQGTAHRLRADRR